MIKSVNDSNSFVVFVPCKGVRQKHIGGALLLLLTPFHPSERTIKTDRHSPDHVSGNNLQINSSCSTVFEDGTVCQEFDKSELDDADTPEVAGATPE